MTDQERRDKAVWLTIIQFYGSTEKEQLIGQNILIFNYIISTFLTNSNVLYMRIKLFLS